MNKRLYDIGPRILANEKNKAATKIQKIVRGEQARKEVPQIKAAKEIKVAKDKIGAAFKRLLTERAETHFNPSNNKAYIKNKSTIGQRLAYSEGQSKLVSKKKRDAAILGWKNKRN